MSTVLELRLIGADAARLHAGKPAEGTLRIRAFHEGGQIHIEISDDDELLRSRIRFCQRTRHVVG